MPIYGLWVNFAIANYLVIMQYNRFYLISSMMGDDLYRKDAPKHNHQYAQEVEKRFNLLYEKPLDKFIRSGMPWLRILEILNQ